MGEPLPLSIPGILIDQPPICSVRPISLVSQVFPPSNDRSKNILFWFAQATKTFDPSAVITGVLPRVVLSSSLQLPGVCDNCIGFDHFLPFEDVLSMMLD